MKIRIIRTAIVGGEVIKPSPSPITVSKAEGLALIDLRKAVAAAMPPADNPAGIDSDRSVGLETSDAPAVTKRKTRRKT